MNSMKKYDFCLMNPPYGKNANLAIAFLNKATQFTDNIHCVMPRTIRKPVALNRVDENLHLVSDKTNPDDTFGDSGLTTCSQHWVVKDTKRPKVERHTKEMVSEYFEFVTQDEGDIALGRVGKGSVGQIYLRDEDTGHLKSYDERSTGSHYFIKVHDDSVIDELIALEDKFKTGSPGIPPYSTI